jgi:hypothetical protein
MTGIFIKLGFNLVPYMKIINAHSLIAICLLFLSCNSFGQKDISISEPILKMSGHQLLINYDIRNSLVSDIFRIWVVVTDSAGHNLNATSLNGDIGNNVQGGSDKTIVWNMEKDGYYRNIDVFVEIKAEKVRPVVDISSIDKKTDVPLTKERESVKEFKTIGLLTRSVLIPGWGQAVASDKKPYYYCLMGLVGYGCAGSAIYLNYKANDNYNIYKETFNYDPVNATSLYDKTAAQYHTSNILGFCVAAIWITDITWAAISTVRYHSQLKPVALNNCRIYLTCDEISFKPCVQIKINF